MLMLFSRKALIPMWLVVVFLLFALFGLPMTSATGVLLLILLGVVPLSIMLILWKDPSPTVADVLYQVETSQKGGNRSRRASPLRSRWPRSSGR